MGDGPWKSLPMRRHCRRVARQAENGAFPPEESSGALDIALLKEAGELSLEAVCRVVVPDGQGVLFGPDPDGEFEATGRDHPGSKVVRTLLTYPREQEARGSPGGGTVVSAVADTPAECAIAEAGQVDGLADMADDRERPVVGRHAESLRRIPGLTGDREGRLVRLLERHADEWKRYLDSPGRGSFVRNRMRGER